MELYHGSLELVELPEIREPTELLTMVPDFILHLHVNKRRIG